MKTNDILKELASLPLLADIIRILKSGRFTPPDQDVETGDDITVLGKMNTLEKALYTLVDRCEDEQQALLQVSSIEEDKTQKELKALHDKAESALGYFWESLKARFAEKESELKASGVPGVMMGVHSDFSVTFRIVAEDPKGPSELGSRLFEAIESSGLLDMIGDAIIASGDCDNSDCPIHGDKSE